MQNEETQSYHLLCVYRNSDFIRGDCEQSTTPAHRAQLTLHRRFRLYL